MSFKYRKKPVVIEAVQWTRELQNKLNSDDTTALSNVPTFFIEGFRNLRINPSSLDPDGLVIGSREGQMRCPLGDWIIKGVKGELYNCAPDIFEQTYEKIEDQIGHGG